MKEWFGCKSRMVVKWYGCKMAVKEHIGRDTSSNIETGIYNLLILEST